MFYQIKRDENSFAVGGDAVSRWGVGVVRVETQNVQRFTKEARTRSFEA